MTKDYPKEFQHNRRVYRVRFRVDARPTSDSIELEGIPRTVDEHLCRFVVPKLHTFMLAWSQILSAVPSEVGANPPSETSPFSRVSRGS